MNEEKKKNPLILKQKPMAQVVMVLLPLAAAGIWLYGWYSLVIFIVVNVAGFLTEWAFLVKDKKPVTQAVFVTSSLFALSLPVTIPLWMAIVGIVVAVAFGKMVFGGFGKNFANPALVGRAFLYVSFGAAMNASWVKPFTGFPGGLVHWAPVLADAHTSATPLVALAQGQAIDLWSLILGIRAGAIGESMAILIILGGLYLMIRKTANFRVVLGTLIGFLVLYSAFWMAGIGKAVNPLYGLFSGSFLFVLMFMVTDPISSNQTTQGGRWAYGLFVGIMTALIRNFSAWPEAVTFSVLLGNIAGPLIDIAAKSLNQKKKAKGESA